MEQALEVFINGIGGVFAGIAMLYLSIRIIALMPGPDKQVEDKEE